ncbi:hypothetical protein RRG08_046282 [Elysia crispata]|uniref:Uncharacterized protein n=1 Tax=Elysia crispata TaxID=231223 RepID=A0AAE0YM75_9GAST|nr:hypothetical protein RRG08_046282 [Elysia crispata]
MAHPTKNYDEQTVDKSCTEVDRSGTVSLTARAKREFAAPRVTHGRLHYRPDIASAKEEDRLAETLKKWQSYKELLESSHHHLTEEFPTWLAQAEREVPDTLEHAQKQREATQAELEKLYAMKQELLTAARQCENSASNPGSTDQLNKTEESLDSPLNEFADQVNKEVASCINQAEKRLDGLRETIKKWDSVDRMRQELRHWLRTKQEELADIESQPSKLHSEAAELDVERLKAFREEVRAKAPAIEELQIFHSTLTQHNPSMTDPVIRAIKDDWEELLGQLDILLHERETAKAAARNLQAHQDTMDEDLENYVRELERIDRADNPMLNKSREIQMLGPESDTHHLMYLRISQFGPTLASNTNPI